MRQFNFSLLVLALISSSVHPAFGQQRDAVPGPSEQHEPSQPPTASFPNDTGNTTPKPEKEVIEPPQARPTDAPESSTLPPKSAQATAVGLPPQAPGQAPLPPPHQPQAAAEPAHDFRPTIAQQVSELQDFVEEQRRERQERLRQEAPTWAIHINPLNLLFDEVVVGTDRALTDRVQLTAQASYYDNTVVVTDNQGLSIGAGARFYPDSNGYQGWYVAPTVSYRALTAENTITGESATAHLVVPALYTGHQWIWKPMMVRTGAGIGYILDAGTSADGVINTPLSTVAFGLDGAVGVVF